MRRFGNPDDVFAQSRPKSGLITQAEVRAIALAQLDVQPASVVWDIGAGSGSVAIEAAQLAYPGMVYAIEQDAADYHLILANAETFGVRNLTAIHGTAPAVFAGLPAPDAIFVGGTGNEVSRLLEGAFGALRPGGNLVVNVATLESLGAAYATLQAPGAPRASIAGQPGPGHRATGNAALRGGQSDFPLVGHEAGQESGGPIAIVRNGGP